MSEEKFIVLDTETTGLSPKTERIVEVAAMEFDPVTGATGRYFHAYINPQKFVPPQSTQVHGLSNAFLADKPTFAEVAPHLIRFLRGAKLVAHNAPFDVRFLNAGFSSLALASVEEVTAEVICTRSLGRKAYPGEKVTLDSLCDRYGVDRTKRTLHGALVDCQLLAQVFPHVVKAAQLQAAMPKAPRKRAAPKQRSSTSHRGHQLQQDSSSSSLLGRISSWLSAKLGNLTQ